MRIADALTYFQQQPISGVRPYDFGDQELLSSTVPANWGKDTVTISGEAQVMAQAAQEQEEEAAQKPDAEESFKEYMQEAKGKKPQPFSPDEQIKALKEKLVSLQSQLSQIADNDTMPEEIKQTRLSNINGQINGIMKQIAELEAMKRQGGQPAEEDLAV